MWNNLTHGEWDVDHRAASELHWVGQGSLTRFASVPDHVRRRHQIASSYRASLRRSKTRVWDRLWQFLVTTRCEVGFWYTQRHRKGKIVASPC